MKRTILMMAMAITGVLAQGPQMPTFADFDRDGNGKVTQQEFQQTRQERMTQRAKEGRMMKNAQNAPQFGDIDTNGDGFIDQTEFRNHQRSHMRSQRGGQGQGRGMGRGRNW
ncbi:EF-hand domain-containing protein [Hydrogenimonas sp. SS33]|uniref:EF-hand domain-containing protein n=1 Tax=Hydrogenimonas leucolamina TaxID=2954236 RepID=UPI00336BFB29